MNDLTLAIILGAIYTVTVRWVYYEFASHRDSVRRMTDRQDAMAQHQPMTVKCRYCGTSRMAGFLRCHRCAGEE